MAHQMTALDIVNVTLAGRVLIAGTAYWQQQYFAGIVLDSPAYVSFPPFTVPHQNAQTTGTIYLSAIIVCCQPDMAVVDSPTLPFHLVGVM